MAPDDLIAQATRFITQLLEDGSDGRAGLVTALRDALIAIGEALSLGPHATPEQMVAGAQGLIEALTNDATTLREVRAEVARLRRERDQARKLHDQHCGDYDPPCEPGWAAKGAATALDAALRPPTR